MHYLLVNAIVNNRTVQNQSFRLIYKWSTVCWAKESRFCRPYYRRPTFILLIKTFAYGFLCRSFDLCTCVSLVGSASGDSSTQRLVQGIWLWLKIASHFAHFDIQQYSSTESHIGGKSFRKIMKRPNHNGITASNTRYRIASKFIINESNFVCLLQRSFLCVFFMDSVECKRLWFVLIVPHAHHLTFHLNGKLSTRFRRNKRWNSKFIRHVSAISVLSSRSTSVARLSRQTVSPVLSVWSRQRGRQPASRVLETYYDNESFELIKVEMNKFITHQALLRYIQRRMCQTKWKQHVRCNAIMSKVITFDAQYRHRCRM